MSRRSNSKLHTKSTVKNSVCTNVPGHARTPCIPHGWLHYGKHRLTHLHRVLEARWFHPAIVHWCHLIQLSSTGYWLQFKLRE